MPDDPTAATPADVPAPGDPSATTPDPSVGDVPVGGPTVGDASGTLHVPLTPVGALRVRWVTVGVGLAGALGLLVAFAAGSAPALGVTLLLALVTAWGWPVLSGSVTPNATSVVLAVAAVPVVLSALRDDLQWVAAAVALGIVLSFAAQLLRRTSREGLVLTLMSSFGGLALVGSGATALAADGSADGRQVAVVALAGVAGALLADLLAGARAVAPVLALVALVAAAVAAAAAGAALDGVGVLAALGVGVTAGTASWSLRRVLALEPAMVTVRGQVGAAAGSVLAVGALVHLFSLTT